MRTDSVFSYSKLLEEMTVQVDDLDREIAFIIKRDPSRATVEIMASARLAETGTDTLWVSQRAGKRECLWQETLALGRVGSQASPVRRVYRWTERSIDKHSNILLLPEYTLECWRTTLPEAFSAAKVIELYCDHATHEQSHSELKTNMDLERLPSGKFDTNYLVCQLAEVAMNLLRLIGRNTLN